jgi:hypothetical protein
VAELDIPWNAAEQRNALPDQHRYARDGDMVDLASSQELLDRDAAIHIDVFSASCREIVGDLRRITAHLFNTPWDPRKVERTMAQNYDALVAIGHLGSFKTTSNVWRPIRMVSTLAMNSSYP